METANDRVLAARLFDGPVHGRTDRNVRTLARSEESGQGLIEQGGVAGACSPPSKDQKDNRPFLMSSICLAFYRFQISLSSGVDNELHLSSARAGALGYRDRRETFYRSKIRIG